MTRGGLRPPCVRRTKSSILMVALHVDDFKMTGYPNPAIDSVKNALKVTYKLTDHGTVSKYVGINYHLDKTGYSMTQEMMIREVIERFKLTNTRGASTPLSLGQKLSRSSAPTLPTDIKDMEQYPYRQLLGSLMYFAIMTRPDIAFAISHLSQFASNPSLEHWQALVHVARYLNTTASLRLTYGSGAGDIVLTGYCDADWGSSTDDRRSVTGYCFMINDVVISWNSRKQPTVALSSTEAEYMAASSAAREAIWLRQALDELGYHQDGPTKIYVDNQGAIALTRNPEFHTRSKHIDIQHHFVRDLVQSQRVEFIYTHTNTQVADVLTKPLSADKHQRFTSAMGLSLREGVGGRAKTSADSA